MPLDAGMERFLPADVRHATLIGRVWAPVRDDGEAPGPLVVTTDAENVYALDSAPPFCSVLLESEGLFDAISSAHTQPPICTLQQLYENSVARNGTAPYLLSPVDLQAIKAAGVTYATSLIERIVEERAQGDPARAAAIRAELVEVLGGDLSGIRPGSDAAMRLEKLLRKRGMWSQYCEVAIGPHAEIFSKSQPLSSVGYGAEIGLHPDSRWNNPEPELAVIVTSRQRIVGATLANDVNLRDFEGRSALLLGQAKDNNASCALGPFIRLLDDHFTMKNLRSMTIRLSITGKDGFALDAEGSVSEMSRDLLELVEQCSGSTHQYPDGFVLMTGTFYTPNQDRGEPGSGFTHKSGDRVHVSAPELGCLANDVSRSDVVSPWTMGFAALTENLKARNRL